MPISQVTPYNVSEVSVPILTPAKEPAQPAGTAELTAPKAYSVELSDSAQVRSLKLQGFSVAMISTKMGLDIATINQYLGITETISTYVEPKRAYTEPAPLSESRAQLAQDLNQLAIAQFTWSSTMNRLLPTAITAKQG